jgi:uncharacterized protein (DUF1499 family)
MPSFTSLLTFRLLLTLALFAPIDAMAQRRLPPCPDKPNCVSTDAERDGQRMMAVPFTDTPVSAFARAKAAVLAESRTKIVAEGPDWMKAESKSFLFRFVDDVEVVVDADSHTFRFRSASRLGHSDFGANKNRMERITARLRGGEGS